MFLWKVIQGALPTGSQLISRGIDINPACKKCGELESIHHVLFSCRFARKVWDLAPFCRSFDVDSIQEVKGVTRGNKCICLPPVGISFTPLFPWIARNQDVFNLRSFSAEETLLKAIKEAVEFQLTHRTHEVSPGVNEFTLCRTDAAWRKDLMTAGLGWTFASSPLDNTRRHSAICTSVASPLMAEALAVRSALTTARSLLISRIKIESDCSVLIKAIHTKSMLAEIHGVLSDILLCSASFQLCSFNVIPRTANRVADSLAKSVLQLYAANIL